MNQSETFKMWEHRKEDSTEFKNFSSFQNPNNKDRVILFESGEDLIECCKNNFRFMGGANNWNDVSHQNTDLKEQDGWRFGYDFKNHLDTMAALSDGRMPIKYVDRVAEKKQELFNKVPRLFALSDTAVTKRRRRVYNEDGAELDIDRYMCADPAMFVSLPKQDVRSRTARIYFNIGAAGGVDASTITDNVITMAAICDILTSAGVSVEVYAAAASRGPISGTRWVNIACKAKHANEPMDIQRMLSFALPGFYRQLIFGCWSNIREQNERSTGGLGTVAYESGDLKAISEFFDADIKINAASIIDTDDIETIVGDIETFFNVKKEDNE